MDDINSIDTQAQSVTATICEQARVYGATPERGEFDPRAVWDEDDAMEAVSEAFRILAEGIGPDGTQLSDERESLLWGFVNTLDAQVRRLDRASTGSSPGCATCSRARTAPRSRPASSNSSPTAPATSAAAATPSRRCATRRPNSTARRPARSGARATAPTCRRPASSPPPPSTRATSSEPARTARHGRTCRREPSSPSRAARTSATPASSPRYLDKTRAKYANLVLVHGGGPGVDRVAAQWAERNGVDQVVCKPDWGKHGRAAPFRRNDEILNLLPKGVIAFPGNGITDNLVDKAIKLGIPVQRVKVVNRIVSTGRVVHRRGRRRSPSLRVGSAPLVSC